MAQKETESENTFGVGEEILIYAFRYCLTRQSQKTEDLLDIYRREDMDRSRWDGLHE